MKGIKLTVDQYKSAIDKLSISDQNKLIDLYYCYPSATLAEVADKMKIKSVSELNLITGRLDKELTYHSNFSNKFEKFKDVICNKGFFSLIHEEANSNRGSFWRMKTELRKALEATERFTRKAFSDLN